MSHKATNWLSEVSPESMSHAEFRVMFHLCDCHNPSQGCYPSQSYLRAATGLSNGGLNKALANLEGKGLILRRRHADAKTKRRQSTRYILGFELKKAQDPTPLSGEGSKQEQTQDPTPLSGEGAISTQSAKPSPLREQSHLHPSGDKPVIEPVRETVDDARGDLTEREILLEAMGYGPEDLTPNGRIVGSRQDMLEANKWKKDLGLTLEEQCEVIRSCVARASDKITSFRYFNSPMAQFAGRKSEVLKPAMGGAYRTPPQPRPRIRAHIPEDI